MSQGPILAPLLFLLFINDLPLQCTVSSQFLCADDAKFFTLNLPEQFFKAELDIFYTWSVTNKMPFNALKCCFLSFRSNSQKYLYFKNISFTNLKSHKDLGLYITGDLSWDLHISETIKKANSAFLEIKRNYLKLSMSTKLNLYKSMILSIITYLSWCFYPSIKSNRLLESLQRKNFLLDHWS